MTDDAPLIRPTRHRFVGRISEAPSVTGCPEQVGPFGRRYDTVRAKVVWLFKQARGKLRGSSPRRPSGHFPPFLESRKTSEKTLVAVAANTEGKREIVGLHVKPKGLPDIGPSEAESCWATFLRGLVKRGLRGIRLVTPLRRLRRQVRPARGPQGRDPARNGGVLAVLPRPLDGERPGLRSHGPAELASAALRQARIQPDRINASQTLRHVADQLRAKWPQALSLRETPSSARSSTTARPTCWRTWASPPSIARNCTARTPSSG